MSEGSPPDQKQGKRLRDKKIWELQTVEKTTKKKERSPHRREALRDKCIRSSKKQVNELQGMSIRSSLGINERTLRKSE